MFYGAMRVKKFLLKKHEGYEEKKREKCGECNLHLGAIF